MLIQVSDIEAYTGVTYDSAETAVIEQIINSVQKWIECYTGCKFDDDVYSQRVHIIDNMFTISGHIQWIYGGYYGVKKVMEVTPPSANASIQITQDGDTLRLISGLSSPTNLDISASATLTAVATLISAEAGWTATEETDNDVSFGRTLYAGNFRANPDDSNKITLYAANQFLDFSQLTKNLFESNVECSEAVVVWRGGFPLDSNSQAIVPADFLDAMIRFVIKAYTTRTAAISGDIKSETVGDYSYTLFTGNEESLLNTIAIDYRSVFDCYKCNFDI